MKGKDGLTYKEIARKIKQDGYCRVLRNPVHEPANTIEKIKKECLALGVEIYVDRFYEYYGIWDKSKLPSNVKLED